MDQNHSAFVSEVLILKCSYLYDFQPRNWNMRNRIITVCLFTANQDFMCPNLTDPANGTVVVESLRVGSIANYSCDIGFKLVGPSSLECEPRGRWSDVEPVCESEYA